MRTVNGISVIISSAMILSLLNTSIAFSRDGSAPTPAMKMMSHEDICDGIVDMIKLYRKRLKWANSESNKNKQQKKLDIWDDRYTEEGC